jgi:hypothetical protein
MISKYCNELVISSPCLEEENYKLRSYETSGCVVVFFPLLFVNNNNNNNNKNSIQFFIIYVPSQQLQDQLQTQHSANTIIQFNSIQFIYVQNLTATGQLQS